MGAHDCLNPAGEQGGQRVGAGRYRGARQGRGAGKAPCDIEDRQHGHHRQQREDTRHPQAAAQAGQTVPSHR